MDGESFGPVVQFGPGPVPPKRVVAAIEVLQIFQAARVDVALLNVVLAGLINTVVQNSQYAVEEGFVLDGYGDNRRAKQSESPLRPILDNGRVGKCRLIVFLRQVCTDLSQNRACASQRTRLPIFCSISKVIPF